MQDKLVTIVIPTYKRPAFICRAIDSCLVQTYKNIEIIVVDDNGKDTEEAKKTYEAVSKYLEMENFKYFVNEKNSGGSFSRNVGLFNSKGEYITFLDDDDEIDERKIEAQVEALEKLGEEYSSCYTGYKKLLGDGSVYYSDEKISGDVYKYALSRSIYVGSGSNLLVRTKVAKEINGYDVSFKRNQDLEFMTRVLKNYKLAYVDEPLLCIHYEIREVKRTYEFMVKIDEHYVNSFRKEIDALGKKEAKEVYDIIALERFRKSLGGNVIDGIRNLIKNRVSIISFIKYICYLVKRVVKKQSYGFKLS